MKNFEKSLSQKAFKLSAAAFLLILLPRLLRRILGITAGRTNFAGQDTGFLAWSRKKGRILFCSTEYDPDWDIHTAVPMAKKGILLALVTRLFRKKS